MNKQKNILNNLNRNVKEVQKWKFDTLKEKPLKTYGFKFNDWFENITNIEMPTESRVFIVLSLHL